MLMITTYCLTVVNTGARMSVQLFNEMRRRKQKYGVVTLFVGTGHPPSPGSSPGFGVRWGAASVFELLN